MGDFGCLEASGTISRATLKGAPEGTMTKRPKVGRRLDPLACAGASSLALALSCTAGGAREAVPAQPDAASPPPRADARGATSVPTEALPAVPASTQDPAVRALADSIVALGPGPLGTPSQLKARLALPQGLGWSYDSGKRTSVELSGATLTLTMRNGTWEPPSGNSQFIPGEPTVESLELRGPGNLGLVPPKDARVVATPSFRGPAVVVTWPGDFYLAEPPPAGAHESPAGPREPKPEERWTSEVCHPSVARPPYCFVDFSS